MQIDWLKKVECSFSEVAGVVIDANHTTKTDIHTTQKTQYVQAGNLGGVRIQTPEIHSSHTDHNRFWIETPTGEHVHLNFENLRHPPIVGQSVVLLSAKVVQDQFKKECRTALVNKTAREIDYLSNPLNPLELGFEFSSKTKRFVIYGLCLLGGGFMGGMNPFLFFIGPAVAIYYTKQHNKYRSSNATARLAFEELNNKTVARCKEILER